MFELDKEYLILNKWVPTNDYHRQIKKDDWKLFAMNTENMNSSDYNLTFTGASGVIVIVVGNGHSDANSNPGQDWLHFT